jgi:hypothetical protein
MGFVVDKVASGQVFSPAKTVHSTITINAGQLAEALRRADHPSKESCRLS